MATRFGKNNNFSGTKKKTNQGQGVFTKSPNRGGGPNGSTISKKYKKPYRGQGK